MKNEAGRQIDSIRFKEVSSNRILERMALDSVVCGASFEFLIKKINQHDRSWAKNL